MLTLQQYKTAIDRLLELGEMDQSILTDQERKEYVELAKRTEEFEAYNHSLPSKND